MIARSSPTIKYTFIHYFNAPQFVAMIIRNCLILELSFTVTKHFYIQKNIATAIFSVHILCLCMATCKTKNLCGVHVDKVKIWEVYSLYNESINFL
jgi:hypothetical protein